MGALLRLFSRGVNSYQNFSILQIKITSINQSK